MSFGIDPRTGYTAIQQDGVDTVTIQSTGIGIPAATLSTQAVRYDQSFGLGQTWQNMTASRALATTYTNTTGKPIQAFINPYHATVAATATLTIGADSFPATQANAGQVSLFFLVVIPTGATYSCAMSGGTAFSWHELR